jgi:hypothetical protein
VHGATDSPTLERSDGHAGPALGDPHCEADQADLAYFEENRATGRMPGQVTIRLRYGPRATPWFDLLCVSPTGLEQLAARTGWKLRTLVRSEPPTFYAVLDKAPSPA